MIETKVISTPFGVKTIKVIKAPNVINKRRRTGMIVARFLATSPYAAIYDRMKQLELEKDRQLREMLRQMRLEMMKQQDYWTKRQKQLEWQQKIKEWLAQVAANAYINIYNTAISAGASSEEAHKYAEKGARKVVGIVDDLVLRGIEKGKEEVVKREIMKEINKTSKEITKQKQPSKSTSYTPSKSGGGGHRRSSYKPPEVSKAEREALSFVKQQSIVPGKEEEVMKSLSPLEKAIVHQEVKKKTGYTAFENPFTGKTEYVKTSPKSTQTTKKSETKKKSGGNWFADMVVNTAKTILSVGLGLRF